MNFVSVILSLCLMSSVAQDISRHDMCEHLNALNDYTRNCGNNAFTVTHCDLEYEGKCFHAILRDVQVVHFPEAEAMCNNIGWKLANIYSKDHYDKVDLYLRSIFGWTNYNSAWLGMTYNSEMEKIYFSNGGILTEKLPWYLDHPDDVYPICDISYYKMSIYIRQNATSTAQGMMNRQPASTTRGALCEL